MGIINTFPHGTLIKEQYTGAVTDFCICPFDIKVLEGTLPAGSYFYQNNPSGANTSNSTNIYINSSLTSTYSTKTSELSLVLGDMLTASVPYTFCLQLIVNSDFIPLATTDSSGNIMSNYRPTLGVFYNGTSLQPNTTYGYKLATNTTYTKGTKFNLRVTVTSLASGYRAKDRTVTVEDEVGNVLGTHSTTTTADLCLVYYYDRKINIGSSHPHWINDNLSNYITTASLGANIYRIVPFNIKILTQFDFPSSDVSSSSSLFFLGDNTTTFGALAKIDSNGTYANNKTSLFFYGKAIEFGHYNDHKIILILLPFVGYTLKYGIEFPPDSGTGVSYKLPNDYVLTANDIYIVELHEYDGGNLGVQVDIKNKDGYVIGTRYLIASDSSSTTLIPLLAFGTSVAP